MNKLFYLSLLFMSPFVFNSCDTDEDDHDHDHDHDEVVAPATYTFERDGASTVSFSGQTCRLQMAKDIYDSMNSENAATVSEFLTMFNEGTGFDFAYTCGKNVGGKTAASPTASSTVKSQFEDMFTVLVDEVYPNWTSSASMGVAGQITTSSGSTYQVDGKGLEIDQAFIKV